MTTIAVADVMFLPLISGGYVVAYFADDRWRWSTDDVYVYKEDAIERYGRLMALNPEMDVRIIECHNVIIRKTS